MAKPDTACANGACRASGRTAGTLRWIPWIARATAEPHVTLGKRTKRELRNQHGTRRVQALHDSLHPHRSVASEIPLRPMWSDSL